MLYRDADGECVCTKDVCPHRSAPLSMGEIQNGVLRCFYHGWGFGKEGKCVTVPTAPRDSSGNFPRAFCADSLGVAEHDGLLYVWRGHPLTADARKLPQAAANSKSFVVETTLDHGVDWERLVQRSLQAPHMSLPSGQAVSGGSSENAALSAPVTVRHAGVDGGLLGAFDEVAHIVPIAPGRARVLLRQSFNVNPLLGLLLQVPALAALLTFLVQSWNYQVALEEAQTSSSSSSSSSSMAGVTAGAPERVASFRTWLESAQANEPYFAKWGRPLADKFGYQEVDEAKGTYGLKKSYVRDTPLAEYAPLQSEGTLLDKYKAMQDSIVAALLTAPAGLLTYKTVAPVVAASLHTPPPGL